MPFSSGPGVWAERERGFFWAVLPGDPDDRDAPADPEPPLPRPRLADAELFAPDDALLPPFFEAGVAAAALRVVGGVRVAMPTRLPVIASPDP
jgi:hypothetical protein